MSRAPRHAILESLSQQIGETCNFGVMAGSHVVYLDRVESAWPFGLRFERGSHVPLHCTASGKLLLALLPKASRDRLVAQLGLPRYTPNTITDPRRLAGELARIRASRYSTDNEEFHAGLVCVAVPVVGKKRACAALAVHAPASRMPLERATSYLPVLRKAAAAMADALDS